MKTLNTHRLITLICLVAILATVLLPGTVLPIASAADLTNSSVLYDLQTDPTFNIEDYPADDTNHSVELFQIAESDTKELYVYVYQPNYENSELNPYQIAISTVLDKDNPVFETYELTLTSSYKTLFKYKVEGLTVGDGEVRCYNISQMWRKHIASIDGPSGNDNTIDGIGIEVAQLWTAETRDGKVQYFMQEIEVVTITSFYHDHIAYYEGFKLYVDQCYAHYIAFSTDRQIDTLLEADVEYYYQRYSRTGGIGGGDITYIDPSPVKNVVTLKYKDFVSNEADGLFAKKYTWDRITTVADFLADEDIEFTDTAKNEINKHQWVLNFAEFPRSLFSGNGFYIEDSTEVSQVTILRLKFETNGKVYNLGTVSNIVTGDNKPGNTNTTETIIDDKIDEILNSIKEFFKDLWEKAKTPLLIVIGIVVGLIVIFLIAKIVSNKKSKQVITVQTNSTATKPKKTKKPVKKTVKNKKSNKGGKR